MLVQILEEPFFDNSQNHMKKDPSLEGGFVEIYQKQLSVLVRSESLSFEDQIMARIFKNTQGYKVEMTSQSNISFFYLLNITQKELAVLVDRKLEDQVAWFRDIFSGEHRYQLTVHSVEAATLVVEQQQKFKNYELATFDFQMGREQSIKESLMFRYERMKLRQKMLDSYWQNMTGVIKAKNPSLLLQMQHKYKRTAFK